MDVLFKKTKRLERKVDLFLDLISQGSIIFEMALSEYIEGRFDQFEEHFRTISEMEHNADDLRKEIETQLYLESLIPDSRGDVLGILENMDNVMDASKRTIAQFSMERPTMMPGTAEEFLKLARISKDAVESLVQATRAFFRDIHAVKDHIHKVKLYEGEADKVAERLKRYIFSTDENLAHKIQMRFFVNNVESVSDEAESVAERLSIYTIKRTI